VKLELRVALEAITDPFACLDESKAHNMTLSVG